MDFKVFRHIFGIYLIWHFCDLLPYADKLFGGSMPYDPSLIPNYYVFPNALNIINAKIFITTLIVLSLLFTCGFYHRICSILLWYGWAALFNRNILISNPGIPYIGLLLILCAFIKTSGPIKPMYVWSVWAIIGITYTISGIDKLGCESWLNGSAVKHILMSPLARDNYMTAMMLAMPDLVLQILTWLSLALELSTLPFGLFYHTRKWYWLGFMMFHIGILSTINFGDLTYGVIMIHVFTFETRWLGP